MAINIYCETFEKLYYLTLTEARRKLSARQRKNIAENSYKNWDEEIEGTTLMKFVFGEKAPTNSQYWANRLSAHRKPKKKDGKYHGEFLEENSEFMIAALNLIGYSLSPDIYETVDSTNSEAHILYQMFLKKHYENFLLSNSELKVHEDNIASISKSPTEANIDSGLKKISKENLTGKTTVATNNQVDSDDVILAKVDLALRYYFQYIKEKKFDKAFLVLTKKMKEQQFANNIDYFSDVYYFTKELACYKPSYVGFYHSDDGSIAYLRAIVYLEETKTIFSNSALSLTEGFYLGNINDFKARIDKFTKFVKKTGLEFNINRLKTSDFFEYEFPELFCNKFKIGPEAVEKYFPDKREMVLQKLYEIILVKENDTWRIDDIYSIKTSSIPLKNNPFGYRYIKQ